jgi:hypothetical protein
MSIHFHYNPKGNNMKTIFNAIAVFFTAVGEASYAAHLARNGQYKRASDIITK